MKKFHFAGAFAFSQAEKPKACPAADRLIKSEVETAVSLLQAVGTGYYVGDPGQ